MDGNLEDRWINITEELTAASQDFDTVLDLRFQDLPSRIIYQAFAARQNMKF